MNPLTKRHPLRFLLWIILSLPRISLGQDVLVYEAWDAHMESAGGWVAADQGLFRGTNVIEVEGGPGISPIQMVVAAARQGVIGFGNDSPENILRAREKEGLDLVAVSVDFQTSPMRIVSWNPIRSAGQLLGDFGIWDGHEAKAICAIGKGWRHQVTFQPQGGDLRPWFEGDWAFASTMTYSNLITAQREVRKMGKKFYTIDYKDLGIDWMGNVLFTTAEVIRQYPNVVQSVVTGRYKGFKWAVEKPRETFRTLHRVNGTLDFHREMDAVDPIKALLFTADTRKRGLGFIQPKRWENVAQDMFRAGLLERLPELKTVYAENFPSSILP